ncbi:hypothetical protein F4860DRAFT_490462 [Xylaria cubensis]|nr:hypothetical protein F4860DRAFT_490462 [Xylaria cubensis]
MTYDNAPETPSIHSSDAMRIDLEEKKSILINIRRMIQAVANLPKEETVLCLPYKNPTFSISTANFRCAFNPLPENIFDEMLQEKASLYPYTFSAPTNDALIWWARPVTKACDILTQVRDDSQNGSKKEIKCAGFSPATYSPNYEVQELLLVGERNPLWWHATALLFSTTRCYGSIIVTYQGKREVTENEILRSEVLALLSLLEVASIHEIENQYSCKLRNVFLLSFINTKVRVIEACFCAPYGIQVSIRQVIDKVPTSNDRDAKFRELVAWTMFVEADTKPYNPLGSSNKPFASATSAAAKSFFDDNHDLSSDGSNRDSSPDGSSRDSSPDGSSRDSSPDASFVGKYDEVNK